MRLSAAKRLKKLSPGPKISEGRSTTASGRARWTATSPSALLRA
jgi:hypothetical protein